MDQEPLVRNLYGEKIVDLPVNRETFLLSHLLTVRTSRSSYALISFQGGPEGCLGVHRQWVWVR